MSLTPTILFENTHFINLEHRLDRLVHVKKELAKIHVNGTRFNAIKLANGAVGCSMSHLKCLEEAKQNGSPYVFVCEDDIQFLDPELFLKNLGLFCESIKDNWDVLIISGNICPPFQPVGDFCVKLINCQTTTGYIVQQHYYDTLIANYREGITKLLADPANKREYAIDMYWKHLQIRDRWYMIVPPTVVQMEGFSDVEGRETNYKHLMTDLNKEWLFKKSMIVDRPQPQMVQNVPIVQNSMYSFKPATQNLQTNSIQQGFNLGIKYRNQFDLINGKMNMTNK
jgi:GR25 family glycosyltransferase involved in LPS biosynthesis